MASRKSRSYISIYKLWLCCIAWLLPFCTFAAPQKEYILPPIISAIYTQGDQYRLAGDYAKALNNYNQGMEQSRIKKDPLAVAIGLYYVAQLKQIQSTPEGSDSLAIPALAQMQMLGYYGKYYRKGLVLVGYDATLIAKYNLGAQIAQRLIKLAKAAIDTVAEAYALDIMSMAYYGVEQFEKSDSLQQEAITKLRHTTNYAVLAEILANNMVVHPDDLPLTINMGREILYSIRPKQENLQVMAAASVFIGHAHGAMGREDSMIFYLQQAERMNDIVRDPINSINLYGSYVFLYKKRKEWDKAIASVNKFLNEYTSYVGIDQQREFREHLIDAYSSKGDYKNAFINSELVQQLNDSLDGITVRGKIEELDRRYKVAVKDEQIRSLAYRSQASARQNLQLITIISLLLAGSMLILWQYIRKRRALNIIAKQRVRLTFLMKEIHHRVKNNLQVVSSLISLQQEALQDPAVEAAFENTQLRIGSMALLHQQLYQDDLDGLIDLDNYLEQLVEVAVDTQGNKQQTHIEVGRSGVLLSLDTAAPIGMMVSELIINSCKYAVVQGQQLHIKVRTTSTDKHITLHYQDNGPGMPDGWERNTQKSLGMRLIRMMIRQLKGKMIYSYEGGSSFRFEFPQ